VAGILVMSFINFDYSITGIILMMIFICAGINRLWALRCIF